MNFTSESHRLRKNHVVVKSGRLVLKEDERGFSIKIVGEEPNLAVGTAELKELVDEYMRQKQGKTTSKSTRAAVYGKRRRSQRGSVRPTVSRI